MLSSFRMNLAMARLLQTVVYSQYTIVPLPKTVFNQSFHFLVQCIQIDHLALPNFRLACSCIKTKDRPESKTLSVGITKCIHSFSNSIKQTNETILFLFFLTGHWPFRTTCGHTCKRLLSWSLCDHSLKILSKPQISWGGIVRLGSREMVGVE